MGNKINAAKAIVRCLKMEGVTKVFSVPGESFLPLLDALYEEDAIQVVAARHEGGASFMAEGYAKASLKPGVVLATRGVGAANLSIGVHTARQDSTPMVVFLGQVHSRFLGREGFQEVDLPHFFQPIAKWAVEIRDPARIPELVQRAFRIAKNGRPGPVILSLPEDILDQDETMNFGPKSERATPAPSSEELMRVEQWLNTARKPVVIAGGGVKWAGAEEWLLSFAEKFSLPVLVAFRRHDVFPNNHPLYGGHLGLGMGKEVMETITEADGILALGTRLSEVTTGDYRLISPNKTLIHIDIDGETIGKTFPPAVGIVSDLKEALKRLSHLSSHLPPPWKEWAIDRCRLYQEGTRLEISEKSSIYEHVIDSLSNYLPKDTIITNDAGNFAGWLHQYYSFNQKRTYIGPTSGAMGYGMPAAIGAKLANPDKIVVSLSGDGGFFMTFQELETAVRYHIPIISLVFNNQMYGTIRMHQEIRYPNRVIATDLGRISFKDLAVHVGAKGYVAKSREEFDWTLVSALRSNRPAVIEILADKEHISVGRTIADLHKQN